MYAQCVNSAYTVHNSKICLPKSTNAGKKKKKKRAENVDAEPKRSHYKKKKMFFSKLVWCKILQTFYIFFLLSVYFKNLIVGLHVLYILNMYVKFHSNQTLFTIRSINLYFMHNFKLQKLEI